jgi:transketolase
MRTQFIKELEKRAESDEKIFLLCGDLGFSVLENFRNKFPDRFLNVGIAEQNMAGIAAGLSLEGYKVFIYSIGNFPSLRAIEQIRYDICYHELNVTIVSVGAGFAYGPLGCSHHATEDFAILRSLPNMIVYNPADPLEVTWSMDEIFNSKKASYLRLGKAGEPIIHQSNTKPNSIVKIQDGSDVLVLTTGSITEEVFKQIKELKINCALYSVYKISEEIQADLVNLSKRFNKMITVEENQLNGGFGSFILEQLNNGQVFIQTVHRFGIKNKFIGFAGSQNFLRSEIVKDVMNCLTQTNNS